MLIPLIIEVLWIKIHPTRLPRTISHIVVAVVYYPPNSPVADSLLAHLHETIETILTNNQLAGTSWVISISTTLHNFLLTHILNNIISNVANQYVVPQVCTPLRRSDHSM